MIFNNWGHIITFLGRGFIGGDYHYLGARLIATYITYNIIEQRSEYLPRTAFETKRPTTPPVQQATYKEGASDNLSKKRSKEKLRLNQAIIQI